MALTLTPAEQTLIDGAKTGAGADFRVGDETKDDPAKGQEWGEERTIRAEVLRRLCTGEASDDGPAWQVGHSGVRIRGARIFDQLDLSGAAVTCRLFLESCFFEEELWLPDARTRTIALPGCRLPGLVADRARIDGACLLRHGFHALGEVRFIGAEIGGDLDCERATLSNPNGPALFADGLKIHGDLFLRKGLKVQGEIRLVGAEIDGDLDFGGATLSNPNGPALNAGGLKVHGGLYLHEGFKTESEIRLIGAEIDGDLAFRGAALAGVTVDLDRAVVNGALLLDGLKGQENKEKRAPARLDLTSARIGALVDEEASWPAAGQLILDGFTYRSLAGKAPTSSRARLQWLKRQPAQRFRPQPYEQLATVLRGMGHEQDARKIAIAKRRELRRSGLLGRSGWLGNFLLQLTIGYGYEPWRALIWAVGFILIGAVGCQVADTRYDLFVPSKERIYLDDRWTGSVKGWMPADYPPFHPVLYAADVFLPIIDFHQKGYWEPNESKRGGVLLKVCEVVYILAGWILTTLAVAGFTGLVKKE